VGEFVYNQKAGFRQSPAKDVREGASRVTLPVRKETIHLRELFRLA